MDNSKKAIRIFGIVTIMVLSVLVLAIAPVSAATIYYVNPGDKIQDKINAASDGDTIIVRNGTYTENVVVNKSDLIIRSENGSAVTIIISNQTDMHVVNITDQTNVTLEGFTIRDAHGASKDVAGIYMDNATECTISNNNVTNISTTGLPFSAYGIHLTDSNNNTFSSNISVSNLAPWRVYGIMLWNSSNNIFSSGISVSNITATEAYGIELFDSSNNNTFSSGPSIYNIETGAGWFCGIWVYKNSNNNTFSSGPTISNITANKSAQGIRVSWSSNNNTFTEFTVTEIALGPAFDFSYGIFIDGRTADCSNNVFSAGSIHNTYEPGIYYAVRLYDCTHSTIIESEIMDNDHGFWLINSNNNTIERNMIVNNTAAATGAHLDDLSKDNRLLMNCFIANQPYQAIDNGTNNTFDSNFWDEWSSGSGPYEIAGTANNSDENPLDECPVGGAPAVIEQVPALTPAGVIALISVLSTVLGLSIRLKRRKEG